MNQCQIEMDGIGQEQGRWKHSGLQWVFGNDAFQHNLALQGAIQNLDANGKTALYDGMLAAHDVLREATRDRNRINAIVLLSDGADTAETSTLDTVVQRFEETDIAVFPVAYGEDADKNALQAIADFARTIVIEGSAGEINKVFENLSRYF